MEQLELKQANLRMSQLYQIDRYEDMDIPNEVNINLLLKAKEYFTANLYNISEQVGYLKKETIRTEMLYQAARAEAKVKYMEEGSSATKAQSQAECSEEFITAKSHYAEVIGKYEEYKLKAEYLKKRIDQCSQHISYLKQEDNFNQHIK